MLRADTDAAQPLQRIIAKILAGINSEPVLAALYYRTIGRVEDARRTPEAHEIPSHRGSARVIAGTNASKRRAMKMIARYFAIGRATRSTGT